MLQFLCNSHAAEHGLPTYPCGLQHQRDNAEEIDVGIVHSELNKDSLGVDVKPGVVIKVPEDSTWTNQTKTEDNADHIDLYFITSFRLGLFKG